MDTTEIIMDGEEYAESMGCDCSACGDELSPDDASFSPECRDCYRARIAIRDAR